MKSFPRLHLLDALRGFAIINVVIYHFLYDVFIVYDLNDGWTDLPYIRLWQVLGSGLFILISGMVFALNKRFWRQGLQLNLLGLAITLLTVWLMPEQAVYYGILTFFGCALWVMGLIRPLLQKLPPLAGMLLAVLCYMLTMDINDRQAMIAGISLWQWPDWLYIDELALIGFKSGSFHSADYFPLLPNIFVMIFGWFLYSWLHLHGREHWLLQGNVKVFTLPGRHSLLIYLLHQPILMGLCMLIFG